MKTQETIEFNNKWYTTQNINNKTNQHWKRDSNSAAILEETKIDDMFGQMRAIFVIVRKMYFHNFNFVGIWVILLCYIS